MPLILSQKNQPLHNNYIKYSSIGFQMLVVIGAFAYLGVLLDKKYAAKPYLFTALFSVIGVCISLYQAIKQLIE